MNLGHVYVCNFLLQTDIYFQLCQPCQLRLSTEMTKRAKNPFSVIIAMFCDVYCSTAGLVRQLKTTIYGTESLKKILFTEIIFCNT